MYIHRYPEIAKLVEPGKVLVVYGPRQCGKTSLVKKYLETYAGRYSFETGTLRSVQEKFYDGPRKEMVDTYGLKYDLVVIDEAQMIPNIGEAMKALVDLYPSISVILTGSSSFELAGQVGEPLFGRQRILTLFPLWEKELLNSTHDVTLEERLIYGSYPAVVVEKEVGRKRETLELLSGASLFKDVLAFDRLQKPKVLLDLVTMLAYQVGSEVSFSELGGPLGIDEKTVERYIDLLEKTFIIFPLRPYASNERKTIRKKKKYYFYDLGVRNAMIGNFETLSSRNDIGALWENFCIVERMKKNGYTGQYLRLFFWKAYAGGEVDYIELQDERMHAYECKWSEKARVRSGGIFAEEFPGIRIEVVNRENFRNFIL
jgi:hypothetical protein